MCSDAAPAADHGHMRMLMLVHLAPWRVGIRRQSMSWLTAKLTAKPHDTTGPQRMVLDAYTRPELRRCEPRRPAEQLTSPRVEVPNGVEGNRFAPRRNSIVNHRPGGGGSEGGVPAHGLN
jgi:hypothetical protein